MNVATAGTVLVVATTEALANSPVGNTLPPGLRLRRAAPELGLVAWTLFVWLGRIRNVAADEALEGAEKLWPLALSGGLSSLAVALLVTLLLRPLTARPVLALAYALAGVSSAVWIVRGIDIALGTHELGFKVVHTVLAVVTLSLSVLVVRHLRSSTRYRNADG
jgi:hypothetical protein